MLSRRDTVGRVLERTIGPVSLAAISPAQVVRQTKTCRRVHDTRAPPARAAAANYGSALTCLEDESRLNALRYGIWYRWIPDVCEQFRQTSELTDKLHTLRTPSDMGPDGSRLALVEHAERELGELVRAQVPVSRDHYPPGLQTTRWPGTPTAGSRRAARARQRADCPVAAGHTRSRTQFRRT